MSRYKSPADNVVNVNPVSNFTIRILSVGHVKLQANQWRVPRSTSLFWSVYIPENNGLELGTGKSMMAVSANSIAIVPPGCSAARDNKTEIRAWFFHFDLGGFVGIQLAGRCQQIAVVSAQNYKRQITTLNETLDADNELRLQLYAQALVSAALAECLAADTKKDERRSAHDAGVKQILPAIHAIEERLNSVRCQSLKVSEMAELCGLNSLCFSRTFFEATGKSPARYCQDRKIAVAAQQVLFSKKSIDEITGDFAFSNRFYFSKVFKQEVGITPAAYRNLFRVQS